MDQIRGKKGWRTGLSKRNFTLIELLIVVAIIAILASLLLPALNSARKKARAMTCLSNLKTCGTLLVNYADSFDSYVIMRSTAKDVLKNSPRGTIANAEYWPMYLRDAGIVGNLASRSKKDFALCCPEYIHSTYKEPYSSHYGVHNFDVEKNSYSKNFGGAFAAQDPTSSLGALRWLVIFKRITNASKATILHELVRRVDGKLEPYPVMDTVGLFHFRHIGRTQILYGDGHAEAKTAAAYNQEMLQYNAHNYRTQWKYYRTEDGTLMGE